MNTIALILSLIGIVLNARKNIWCWAVWIIADICWIWVAVPTGDIHQIIMWTVFGGFNVYGWTQWLKKGT